MMYNPIQHYSNWQSEDMFIAVNAGEQIDLGSYNWVWQYQIINGSDANITLNGNIILQPGQVFSVPGFPYLRMTALITINAGAENVGLVVSVLKERPKK